MSLERLPIPSIPRSVLEVVRTAADLIEPPGRWLRAGRCDLRTADPHGRPVGRGGLDHFDAPFPWNPDVRSASTVGALQRACAHAPAAHDAWRVLYGDALHAVARSIDPTVAVTDARRAIDRWCADPRRSAVDSVALLRAVVDRSGRRVRRSVL